MRQEYPGLRIIAISGGGGVEPLAYKPGAVTTTAYLAAAKEVGADRVLTKPFDRKDLIQAVDDLLGKLQQTDSHGKCPSHASTSGIRRVVFTRGQA